MRKRRTYYACQGAEKQEAEEGEEGRRGPTQATAVLGTAREGVMMMMRRR